MSQEIRNPALSPGRAGRNRESLSYPAFVARERCNLCRSHRKSTNRPNGLNALTQNGAISRFPWSTMWLGSAYFSTVDQFFFAASAPLRDRWAWRRIYAHFQEASRRSNQMVGEILAKAHNASVLKRESAASRISGSNPISQPTRTAPSKSFHGSYQKLFSFSELGSTGFETANYWLHIGLSRGRTTTENYGRLAARQNCIYCETNLRSHTKQTRGQDRNWSFPHPRSSALIGG